MLKDCRWKGRRVSCSAIFTMYPTDRGMCCSFNKPKADDHHHHHLFQLYSQSQLSLK